MQFSWLVRTLTLGIGYESQGHLCGDWLKDNKIFLEQESSEILHLLALPCLKRKHKLISLVQFLVSMLRHKILKSKFNRPAKLSLSLGIEDKLKIYLFANFQLGCALRFKNRAF